MRTGERNLSNAATTTRTKTHSAPTFGLWPLLLCVFALLWPLALQAQNFVYVTNSTGTANTVEAFSVDHAGLLTPVAGSPFSTGGTGATVLCSAIDRIAVNAARNLLFVSNAGNQTISVMHIDPATGVLTAVAGSPFASGLTLDSCAGISMAATPDGNFLMASSNGTIATFAINPTTGALSPASSVTGLPVPMVGMKISGNGQLLAASHESSVSVFTINVDGSLTAVAGSPFAKTGTGLVGAVEFNCDGTLLYAGEGGGATSITDAWSVAPSGALSPILGSPFAATGADSNIVFLTPDNTILLQSDQGSNDMNSFTVNPDGTLTGLGAFGGVGPTNPPAGLASDNSGLFLYAADDAFGLSVFNIIPGVVPTLVADNAILGAGQIQGVAAYPPRSCAHTDFSITQTATPNPVTAGTNITYTISLTNNGPSTASVAINDLLPRNSVTFVSCTAGPGGACDKGNGLNRTITFASLASGQTGTVTIVAASVSTLLNGDTISNTALVSNASAVDPNPVDNSATTNVTVSAPPSATNFIVQNAAGNYFGTTTLTTTLKRTLNGAAIDGRTVTFSLNGIVVGTAVTDVNGVATLLNATLSPGGVPINAGVYPSGIGVSFAGDAQYAASSATSSLTVNKDVLTVTAQNATKVYGDANPAFTYVITGFVNNETVAVVSGTASCTSSANTNTSVGTAPISCSVGTLAATNYSFVFVPATLTITPAPLVLAATDVSRLYGDANPPLTGTVVGLKGGDQATATFATSAVSTSPVGPYPITGTVVPGASFLASNYSITSSGTLTVAPAPLTAAAADASRVYGDPNPAFTGTVTGLKNGDVITATFGVTAGATSPVGTYPILPTFTDPGNKLSNYAVITSGLLTVTPAPLTATANNATRVYGDPNPAFTGTLTGLKNGDAITASFTSIADPTSPVGTYPITATLTGSPALISNYTVTSTNGTLTVTPAPLSVAANNASRLYGDPNPAFTGTITGIKNTDNITATYASAAVATSPIGTFSIVPTLVDPTAKLGNYTVTSVNGTLTVNPAPLSVTAADASRLYGDANPLFAGTITGIKNGDNITATYASVADPTSPVGAFAIVPTLVDPTAKLGNYTVTSNNGTLTVSPAPLTVSSANATRVYGDPNPAFTGTVTGLKNADVITATFDSAATAASPVGSYPILSTLADPGNKLGNYTVISNNGSLTVTPAPLSVSAADAARLYGDPNPIFTGTLAGLKNADAITASFNSVATAASFVGTYPIVPALADPTAKLSNYTVTSTNGTLTVTQAPLSVVAGDATRLYGDPNPAFTGTITGLKNGDNITATYTGADPTSPVGTYAITPSLVDPAGKLVNYSVTSTNGTLTVGPAPLSVTAANATRLYGDANPAFTGTIVGIKNADNITATYASAAVATSPVGTFAIVPTLVDPTLKLSNYTVTSLNGTLTVAPAPLSVSAADATRIYGDPNPAFTGTITGIKNADNITATYASAAIATSAVGPYAIVPTLVDPTAKLGNYAVTSNNGTLSVTPAALSVTAGDASRVYGDPNPAFTGTILGIKNADNITATYASAAVAASPVGTFSIVPTLVDPTAKLGNYTVTSTNGTLTVTQAPLSVIAGDASRLYGDPNPAFTGTITGLKNGDNITATYTGADPTSPVGTYAITPSLVDPAGKLGNYAVTSTNGTLTVGPAPLSVTAADASRLYGDANPVFTGSIVGIKNADNITATYASAAVATSPIGTFSIVPTLVDPTAKLTNYTVTSNNGVLTVSPAPLSVTAADASRLYGDPNPAFTGTITGIKNADNITATYASVAVATSAVGSFPIVPTLVDPTAKLSNYTVTSLNGTLTVSPAPLTVSAADATRIYGDPNPAFTGTLTGIKNADNITATYASAADPTSPVGAFSIVPTLVDPTAKLGNYAVTSNNGTLSVTPAALAVTAADASRVYGDPNPAFTGTVTGIKNADNITATFASAADPTSPVGTFSIVPTLVDPTAKLGNYTVTSTNGTLTVTQASLSVVAGDASRLYGDPNPAFTGTITGLKNGDNITATYTGADPTSPVGTYAITPSLVDPAAKLGNYAVTTTNGTLTVGPAPLSVTAADASRLYGDANPVFSGSIVGIKNADNITATYASAAVATSPVGTFAIVPTLVDPTAKLTNYTVTSLNGTLTVAPAPLTVSAADATRIYGDPNPAFTGTITGLKNADNITATYASAAVATSPVGTFPIVPTLVDPTAKLGNYAVTSNNGTLSVTQAALSVTAGDASRVYGDPNPAFTGTITGLKNADSITATYASVADPTSPVGTFSIVPTLVDPTAKLGNYTVTSTNGTLTVTQAPLSVVAGDATRLYGDPNPAFTGTITGLKNGDNITATYTGADPTSPVGTYAITPSLVDPAGKLSNYSVTSTNGTLTVGPAPLSVTAGNASRLYGDANPVFSGSIVGIKNADNITASYASAAVATSPVGTFAIVPTLVDPAAKLGNYTVTSNDGTLTVNPAPLAVAGANASRLYGDPNPAFTGTITGLKNADNVTATFSSVADPTSPAGTYPIVPALVDPAGVLGNYSVTSTDGTLSVGQAPLTVNVASASRAYGDPNPAFTGTITGLKNADNITATYSSVADATSAVGTYPITPTFVDPAAKLSNYAVTSNNGTLTITTVPLVVTAANASRLYGDPNPAFAGTITGLKNADNITASYTSTDPASPIGTYPIVPSLNDPSTRLGNYSVTLNNGTLTVGVAPLSVAAGDASRSYGGANPAFTGTLTGVKNGDNIIASYSSVADAASAVGTYPIVPALADPSLKLANYSVTSSNGTLTVTRATPAVTITAQVAPNTAILLVQVANTGPTLPTGTVQFFEGNATLGQTVTIAPPTPGAIPEASLQVTLTPGTHLITATYAGDATYTQSSSTQTAVVVPAPPTFSFSGTGGNTSATITAGQTATFNISLGQQGGFSGDVAMTCSGAPAGTTCIVDPTSVTLSGSSSTPVPITVTVSNTQNARLVPTGFRPFFVFAGILAGLVSIAGAGKKRKQLVLMCLAAFVVVGMVACGGGPSGPGPVTRPPTNATITVTGTSGAQSATIKLNLTITH